MQQRLRGGSPNIVAAGVEVLLRRIRAMAKYVRSGQVEVQVSAGGGLIGRCDQGAVLAEVWRRGIRLQYAKYLCLTCTVFAWPLCHSLVTASSAAAAAAAVACPARCTWPR